jgi:hypothetical protein
MAKGSSIIKIRVNMLALGSMTLKMAREPLLGLTETSLMEVGKKVTVAQAFYQKLMALLLQLMFEIPILFFVGTS